MTDDDKTTCPSTSAVILDIDAIIRSMSEHIKEQIGEQDLVRFSIGLNPKEPSVVFVLPDCGSEEMAYKTKALGSLASVVIDQIFRWTQPYEKGEEDDDDRGRWQPNGYG